MSAALAKVTLLGIQTKFMLLEKLLKITINITE